MEIKCTLDYAKFKKLDGNRDVNAIEKMKESISTLDLTPYCPILVDNEEFRIIDGQHRYEDEYDEAEDDAYEYHLDHAQERD